MMFRLLPFRAIRVKVFLISFDPVARNLVLRGSQIELSFAHHVAKMIFERILHLRVPYGCRTGLGPQIVDVVRPAQRRRDEIVHLVRSGLGSANSIFVEHLLSKRYRDWLIVHARLPAYLPLAQKNGGARREPRIRNRYSSKTYSGAPYVSAENKRHRRGHQDNGQNSPPESEGNRAKPRPPGNALRPGELRKLCLEQGARTVWGRNTQIEILAL